VPPEELQGPESEAVSALENSGALILGKTVSTEFAYFGPGPTRNPRSPDHTPGGSSSGSAAAVAGHLCVVAIGTETSGSILSPATQNSVVGIKPTVGLVSRSGIVPIAASQDTAGPLARTVADAAIVLGALAGVDAGGRATRESPSWPSGLRRAPRRARAGGRGSVCRVRGSSTGSRPPRRR
jgi:amidase